MFEEFITTRTEKRVFRETLIAFRSFLIREKRRLRKDALKKNERDLKYEMKHGYIWLTDCETVRVRYNKSEIVEGRVVGYPKRERKRFCLEWLDADTNERKRKYFPFTAIESIYINKTSGWMVFNQIEADTNTSKFNYNEFGASEPMIEYMKERVHTVEDVNTALCWLVVLKVSDQLTDSQKQEREDAFFAAKYSRRLQHLDSIVFLYNGKETEGIYISNLSTSEKYFLVQSDAIKTKNHKKYVPNWCFCRVIDSGLPQ